MSTKELELKFLLKQLDFIEDQIRMLDENALLNRACDLLQLPKLNGYEIGDVVKISYDASNMQWLNGLAVIVEADKKVGIISTCPLDDNIRLVKLANGKCVKYAHKMPDFQKFITKTNLEYRNIKFDGVVI